MGGSAGGAHALWCALDRNPTVPGWPIPSDPQPIKAVATLSAVCDLSLWTGDDQSNLLTFEQEH